MTTATTAFTGKSLHAGSKTPARPKKLIEEEIFTPREAILHHAVDVHDESPRITLTLFINSLRVIRGDST